MNILVIGCGKVGSQLSNKLSELGHNLAADFPGYTVAGVAIDQDILRQGGIESCDAVAAVTEDDNTNIMVAQVASDIFHVPRVLARIFDPKRGGVFSQFGLHTVCPTNLSVDAMLAMLTDQQTQKVVYFDSATVSFEIRQPNTRQIGARIDYLQREDNRAHALFGLLHSDGNLSLTYAGSRDIVEAGDRLIYVRVVD